MRTGAFAGLFVLAVLWCASCTCSGRKAPAVEPGGAPKATAKQDAAPARTARPSSELNRTSPMGSNVATVVDYSTDMPLVDIFKSSRPWISGTGDEWEDGKPLDLDENGWVRSLKPEQIARTLMLTMGGHPGGEFTVLYDGEGELMYDNMLNPLDRERSRPGRHLIQLKKNALIIFEIYKTNPRNPIRNIRVLPPGGSCEDDDAQWCDKSHPCGTGRCLPFEQTYEERIFHPKFLQSMSRYAVLRFMDWMGTNSSQIRTWEERPKMTDARWATHGVPIEVVMALAKRLRAEPWINIPHLADDDYVARLAAQVRDTLPEEFRVWVEYSNEVWNAQFAQHDEVAQCPAAKRHDDPYPALLACQAERSDAIFRTWRQAFGESASRVVRVLGTQAAVPWASETVLSYANLHERVDVLAIAPYFGLIANHENQEEISRLSLDELLERTEKEVLPGAIHHMQSQAEVAKRFGVALVTYEGGQHFSAVMGVENNEAVNALYDALNRHPRMKDFYLRYLTAWREAGGQLFVNYTNCAPISKWGRWGLVEYLGQPHEEAPKLEAVMQFIDQNPRWW